MPRDIRTLLSKRSWTGDDVGQAIILSLIHSYRDTLAGQPETTLFDAAQLKTMTAQLKTQEELTRYNRYIGLNNWISINQPSAMYHYQKADSEITRIISVLDTVEAAEAGYRYIEQLPLLVTQPQYSEARAAHLQAQLEGGGLTVPQLVALATDHCLRRQKASPRKANPLHALRKPYQAALVEAPAVRELLRPPVDDDDPDREGMPLDELTRQIYARAASVLAGDAPPAPLTKWDAIQSTALFAVPAADLAAEFPELAEAMLAEAAAQTGDTGLATLPVARWAQPAISARVLYDGDVLGYRDAVLRDAAVFAHSPRAVRNGVAILTADDPLHPSPRVDPTTGHYAAPDAEAHPLPTLGLAQYMPGDPEHRQHIEALHASYATIAESYYYVLGFDKAVAMIAEHIDIPDFSVFMLGAPALAERIAALNTLVALTYTRIHDTRYTDEAGKAQRLAVLRTHFPPVDLEKLSIPAEAIQAAQAMLDDNMRAFEAQDGVFTRTLCTRREEA